MKKLLLLMVLFLFFSCEQEECKVTEITTTTPCEINSLSTQIPINTDGDDVSTMTLSGYTINELAVPYGNHGTEYCWCGWWCTDAGQFISFHVDGVEYCMEFIEVILLPECNNVNAAAVIIDLEVYYDTVGCYPDENTVFDSMKCSCNF